MRTESVIRVDGMNALIEKLGRVDAERFVSIVIREQFDYTIWQKELFKGLELKELSKKAMESIKNK